MINEEQYAVIKAAISSNEVEHESFKRRLNEHDAALKKQGDILIVIERQSNAIEKVVHAMNRVEKTVDSIDKRVAVLEKEPADKWRKIVFEVIKYLVIAAVGFAASFILKTP